MARWKKDRRRQRQALAITAALILVIVAIPAYGYYDTFVEPRRHVVANINGSKHTLGEMVALTKANVAFFRQGGGQPDLGSLPFQILDNIITNDLIYQVAPGLGITATQEDIEERLRENFYPTVPEDQEPDVQQLELEFNESYREYLNVTGQSEGQYREVIRRSLLQAKARELMADRVPGVEEQVYVEWIKLNRSSDTVQQDIDTVLRRISDEGEEFGTLARIFSIDNSFADNDGLVGWVPRGAFPLLDETLFSLEHNTLSGAIFTEGGYYIMRVSDGPEIRDVSEAMREEIKGSVYNQWLLDLRRANDVEVNFTSKEYAWLVSKVREFLPPPATPNVS